VQHQPSFEIMGANHIRSKINIFDRYISRTALAIENCRLFDSLREQISERFSSKEALNVSEERFRLYPSNRPLWG